MRQLDPDLIDRLSRDLRESGRDADRTRMAEAAALKSELPGHAADAPLATAGALPGVGGRDEAAAAPVAAPGDPPWRAVAIEALQPEGVWPDWRMDRLQVLRDHPAVAAAHAREGRDLPEGPGGGA